MIMMDEQDIHEIIMEIARGSFDLDYDCLEPGFCIDPDTNYSGIDFLDLIGFIVEVEDKFNIHLPDDVIPTIKTIRDVINLTKAIVLRLN